MKIATASYGFREWSIDNYLFAAAGLGVKYAEIGYTRKGTLQQLYNTIETRGGLLTSQLIRTLYASPDSGIRRIKELERLSGVKIDCAAINYGLWGVDPAWLDWAKASIKVDIEIASRLGLTTMRVTEIGVPPAVREEEVFDEIAGTGKTLNELGKYAETHGITLMAENHRASSKLMMAVARHFTTPAVALHYDAYNYARIGEDPVSALRKTKEFIRYCHFKDYRTEDGQLPPTDSWWPSWEVGKGEISWEAVVTELATFYTGIVAIEYEKNLHDVLRGMSSGISHIRSIFERFGIKED
jgi:sugar phosphate isomerase/epimerase